MKKRLLALVLALVMVVSILPGSVLADQGDAGQVTTVTTTPESPVQITKTVERTGDDLSLVIEAWATGETSVTQSVKPTDIVLVLDQSGSMKEEITSYTYEPVRTPSGGWTYSNFGRNSKYYVQIDGEYYRVSRHAKWNGGLFSGYYSYYLTRENAAGRDVQLGTTGYSDDTALYTGTLYTRRDGGEIQKLDALKQAVETFVAAVRANQPEEGSHRIAIVGFASGWDSKQFDSEYERYLNSEVFVGGTSYTYNAGRQNNAYAANAAQQHYEEALLNADDSKLDASIGELAAKGGTFTNLGLEMANGILNTVEGESRNRVVVVFTDGVPGWSGFDEDVAEDAVAQAQQAKSGGATVYTVGVFGDDLNQSE